LKEGVCFGEKIARHELVLGRRLQGRNMFWRTALLIQAS